MEEQILDMPGTAVSKTYAGFWIRFVAYVIDAIILYLVNTALSVIFIGSAAIMNPENMEGAMGSVIILVAVMFLIYGIYFSYFHSSSRQATPGKMALGLKVYSEDGERITFSHAFGRFLAWILSAVIIYIGFIIAAFDSKKQALHDKIAKTIVVKE